MYRKARSSELFGTFIGGDPAAGLASWLRTALAVGPAASPSLVLDMGTAAETIPAHLRGDRPRLALPLPRLRRC
jgi:hypothetical protein